MSKVTINVDNSYILGNPDFNTIKTAADDDPASFILEEFERIVEKYGIDDELLDKLCGIPN